MSKKQSSLKRSERLVITLLCVLFLSTVVVAAVKCAVRAPEPTPDNSGVATPTQPDEQPVSGNAQTEQPDGDDPDTPVRRERKEYCYTILVSGVDDDNGGSDTNILVRFDATGKRIDLVSLPRDTLLDHTWYSNKLNFAYAKGGISLLQSEVSNLLGVPVDFYVRVDLKGFIRLVDEIDGVDFDVPINMDYDDPIQDLHIHFSKGMQHLNGQQAMEVVRFRHNNDGTGYGTEDIGRIGTQQKFLKTVAKKLLDVGNVDKLPALVDIFNTYVKTDLTVSNLIWLGTQALDIGMDNLYFHTLPGDGTGYYRRESVYVLDPEATLTLVNEALNPYTTPITMDEMDILVP